MNNFFAKNARRFRATLSICLVLAVTIAVILVVLAVKFSDQYASTVKQTVYDATNSQTKIDNITALAARMEQNKESVNRVNQIVADSKSYEYQDLIVKDIRALAKKAGISITSFVFASQSADGKAKKTTGPLKSETVNITVKNPTSYKAFLNFLHYIELNNTKMQVSSIALTAVTSGDNTGSINSQSLEVEVYVR